MVTSRGSISGGLSTGFYSSTLGVVSLDDIAPFHVALDGHRYLIDLRLYSRSILDSQAPQSDQGARAGEQTLSRAGFWTREQTDWSEGAGQELLDAPDSSERRFLKSRGIEVFDPRKLTLLHDTALRKASANTNLDVFAVGGYLYFVDGTFLRYTTDPDVTTPSFTNVDHTNAIADWATDGARIYTAFGGANAAKVATVGSGAAPAAFGATTPDIIEYANRRLVAADGPTLYELDAAGAKVGGTDIVVDPRTGFVWTAITGSPSHIYVAGNVGDIGEIYAIGIDDTSTALAAPRYAGGLPYGETVNCLAAYPPAQVVVIGTNRGIRVAVVNADGTLAIGERIDIADGVNAVDVRDRFCWFTWTNPEVDTTGLGRVDLSIGTSELTFVPAYAEDLQTPAASAIQGTVTGVASLRRSGGARDRRYFVVSGVGLYGESDNLVEQGSIETGAIRFGVLPDKIFTAVEVRHEPSPGSLGAAVTFEDGTSLFIGGGDTTSGTRMTLDAGSTADLSASLALMVTRSDADATQGPTIRAWSLTALPRPKRVIERILPIILHSKITDLRKNERSIDPLEEYRYLEDLARQSRLVALQEGADSTRVRVASVAIAEGGVRSWQRNGVVGWFETVALVRVLEKES